MEAVATQREHLDGVFVGRRAELKSLGGLLADHGPRVLFLHGLAGAGKTTLLHRFARGAANRASVVTLDCRAIEPTENGFFTALARAANVDAHVGDGTTGQRLG